MKEKLEIGNFKPSIVWAVSKYEEFNKKYFDNKLPKLNIFNFEIDSATNYFGKTSISFIQNEDTTLEPLLDHSCITISNAFILSEYSYEIVLLHEMIHIYQGFILKEWPYHNDNFYQKVNEMKEKNVDVPVFDSPDDYLFKEKKRDYSYEEERAFKTLFKSPRIINEWEENGKHIIQIAVT